MSVSFGGTSGINIVVQSPTRVTMKTPPHSRGVVDVVITNPDGQIVTAVRSFTFR